MIHYAHLLKPRFSPRGESPGRKISYQAKKTLAGVNGLQQPVSVTFALRCIQGKNFHIQNAQNWFKFFYKLITAAAD